MVISQKLILDNILMRTIYYLNALVEYEAVSLCKLQDANCLVTSSPLVNI